MACENRRRQFIQCLSRVAGVGDHLAEVERLFQTARNGDAGVDDKEKSARVMEWFDVAQIDRPTHTKDGLPKRSLWAGYAAIHDWITTHPSAYSMILRMASEAHLTSGISTLHSAKPVIGLGDEDEGTLAPPGKSSEPEYGLDQFDQYNFDEDGYSRHGFHKNTGRDRENFDPSGLDPDGFSRAGYTLDGLDRKGRNAAGLLPPTRSCPYHVDDAGRDIFGFTKDKDGIWRDAQGRQAPNTNIYTGSLPAILTEREQLANRAPVVHGIPLRCPKCQELVTQYYAHHCAAYPGTPSVIVTHTGFVLGLDSMDSITYWKDPSVKINPTTTVSAKTAWANQSFYVLESPINSSYMAGYLNGFKRGADSVWRDPQGRDMQGYSEDGFNVYNRDHENYDRKGFRPDGFDRTGHDKDGLSRSKKYRYVNYTDVKKRFLRPNEDLYRNRYMQAYYSNYATMLSGRKMRVRFEEPGSNTNAADLDHTIFIDPVNLGPNASPGANAIVSHAVLAHEIGHMRFTSAPAWKKAVAITIGFIIDPITKKRVPVPPPPGFSKKAAQDVKNWLNALEDGRIERLQCREFPGLAKSFAVCARLWPRQSFSAKHSDLQQISAALHYTALPFFRVSNADKSTFSLRVKKLYDELAPLVYRTAHSGADTDAVLRTVLHVVRRLEEEGIYRDAPDTPKPPNNSGNFNDPLIPPDKWDCSDSEDDPGEGGKSVSGKPSKDKTTSDVKGAGEEDEPGTSEGSKGAGEEDEPGAGEGSKGAGKKDEPGTSEGSKGAGKKDEPGAGEGSKGAGKKDEPGAGRKKGAEKGGESGEGAAPDNNEEGDPGQGKRGTVDRPEDETDSDWTPDADEWRPITENEFRSAVEEMESTVASTIDSGLTIERLPRNMSRELARALDPSETYRDETYILPDRSVEIRRVDCEPAEHADWDALAQWDDECKVNGKRLAETAFKSILSDVERRQRTGHKAGYLQGRDALRGLTGQRNIYSRVETNPVPGFAASISVDLSGSMMGHQAGGRLYKTIITIAEAFEYLKSKGVSIDYEVRGFNEHNYLFKALDDKSWPRERRARIQTTTRHGGFEMCSHSVGAAATCLSSAQQKTKLIFSITDGELVLEGETERTAAILKAARGGLEGDSRARFGTFGVYFGKESGFPRADFDLMFGDNSWARVDEIDQVAEQIAHAVSRYFHKSR